MRLTATVCAFLVCFCGSAWGAPQLAELRDGVWLQEGLKQYRRSAAHERLSERETNDALAVTAYVCAIVDLEKYLARRAAQLAVALADAQAKAQANAQADSTTVFAGITRAVPILVPLLKSDFLMQAPTCERSYDIVRAFLDKYPDMLDKDAYAVVDRALLAAYNHDAAP